MQGYDLIVTQAHAPTTDNTRGFNCFSIGEGVVIHGGWATFAWVSETPSANELTFFSAHGRDYNASSPKTSPINATIPATVVSDPFAFGVALSEPGLLVDQDVRAELHIIYSAEEELPIGESACSRAEGITPAGP